MKKLLSVLLAVILLCQAGICALAASYTDNVNVTANLQVAPAGTPMSAETASDASVSKEATEAFPSFDFRCVLNMEAVRAKFNDYYTNWISILNYVGPSERITELNNELQTMQVTGSFTAEIVYPNTVTIPAEFLVDNQMIGFDDNAKLIFGNDTRTITYGINTNTLAITFSVVGTEAAGRPGYVVASDLFANLNTYLADVSLMLPNVGTTDFGTNILQGKLIGTTVATGDTTTLTITYQTDPEYATATATVTQRTNRPVPTGSPTPISTPAPTGTPAPTTTPEVTETTYTVNFIVDGSASGYTPVTATEGSTVSLSDLPIPYQNGYSFNGWYTDSAMTNKLTASFVIAANTNLYGEFVRNKSANKLNDTDHLAYIVGYPDGNVRPQNLVTREEVATMFFRLLTEDVKKALLSKASDFSDVSGDRWSSEAIATLAAGDFIHGYDDGSFRPSETITRAEFAAIACRLDASVEKPTHNFTDLEDHWAESYIATAVAKGWITGYEDGTFRPDQPITRAEAATIINRMLNRYLHHDGAHDGANIWPDNPKDAWYHLAIIEATNAHDYTREDGSVYENWTK